MSLDEDILDELLEEYVHEHGTPTSERVLETALVADTAELIEGLQHILVLMGDGTRLDNPATRADVIAVLGRLRRFLTSADRIVRTTNVSGILLKAPPAPPSRSGTG